MPWHSSKLRRLLHLKRSTKPGSPPRESIASAPAAGPSTPSPAVSIPDPTVPALCLPVEIWLEILHHVGTDPQPQYTYAALAQVCKRLNEIVTPFVYESLILPAWQLPTEPELKAAIIAKVWSTRSFGMFCPDTVAWKYLLVQKPGSDDVVPQEYLADIINAIPEGQLHSLVWSCCIPLAPDLYKIILDRQSNISSLWLNVRDLPVTPQPNIRSANSNRSSNSVVNLTDFPNLRHLSLHGGIYSNIPDIVNILSSVEPIFNNLKTFTLGALDITYHHHMHHGEADTSRYTAGAESLTISYPKLETLAFDLSSGTWRTLGQLKLERISQLPNLTSLYARSNLDGMRLLKHFDPAVPIRLTTLHVECCRNDILADFLYAFQGLVDLDIVVSAQQEYISARPIIHHKESLRRLSIRSAKRPQLGNGSFMYGTDPLPLGLMRSLGDYLQNLEEFCATLAKFQEDPFEGSRFPNARLLWIYSHMQENSEPEFWWIPSTSNRENQRKFRMPTSPGPQRMGTKSLPKQLKVIAIGNYPRLNHPYPGPPRVYELIGRDFFITWKKIDLRQLVDKYPDFLSPYSNCMNSPLLKRQMRFQVTEIETDDDDEDDDDEDDKVNPQNLISFANQTMEFV
ncbi:hypothetical protein TWF696_007892 [Orbilia brochopaga]|uniref:F-box domain-containing protein n=1 Tax=Orbilia brochopaga TaxID=3140254 RepID=A0AAV9UNV9_9PEZI